MTEDEIKADLNKISDILTYCRRITFDSYFMLLPNTNEKWTTISRDKFLKRVRESFWKLAIIELRKLYGANKEFDNFSINLLISTLRRDHSKSEWQNKITTAELKEMNASLKTADMKIRIKRLDELRNQHYAHTDKHPNNNIHDIKFYFDDCISLIEKAEETITTLSNKFDSKIEFKDYKGEEMNNFMDNYIEYRNFYAKYKCYLNGNIVK